MLERIKKLLAKESPLKARAIANRLGFDRSEVSSLMHDNKKILQQNEKYEWSLIPKETLITFDGRWITCNLFESTLQSYKFDTEQVTGVKFVLPNDCKFLIESSARLLALCNQLISLKKNVTIDLSNNSNSLHYLNRAGFFDQLNKKITVLPNRPTHSTAKKFRGKNKSIVEFGTVDPKKDNAKLVKQLTDAFVSFTNKKYDNPIFTIFAEMIKNVKEHSETKLKGFAALQRYEGFSKRSAHIQIIVSDSGKGIASTLRPSLKKHYPKLQTKTDIELVKMVLQGKQLSKHGSDSENAHGLGYKGSHEKAQMFNAKYSVRQSDFSLQFEFKNGVLQPAKELTNLVKISGTHICFDFDIDDSVNS